MANQDAKELTMDEILDSIRSILHENGRSQPKAEEKTHSLTPMPFVGNISSLSSLRSDLSEPKTAINAQQQETEVDENDVAFIYSNIQKLMRQSMEENTPKENIADEEPHFSVIVSDTEENSNNELPEPKFEKIPEKDEQNVAYPSMEVEIEQDNTATEIVESFAKIFAGRNRELPVADLSVRKLAEQAVINEIIPVLHDWLKNCLPDIIGKEIERVMVKAGKR